jgi:hypothetical protein
MYTLPPKARFSSSVGNGLFNSASLDLPFAKTKSLVDATTGANLVDFTRASSGTYVDSEGVIRTATTNLLLRSEEFDNPAWTPNRASVTANSIMAPDGALTADKLVEDTTTGLHDVRQQYAYTSGVTYTWSLFLKATGEDRNLQVIVSTSAFPGNPQMSVNSATGQIISSTDINARVQVFPNGWYRASFSATADATGSDSIFVRLLNGTTGSYEGDGTSGIYLWGAQLEQSTTVGEYIPTTSTINSAPRFDHRVTSSVTNLLLQSEDFSTTWAPTRVSVTANSIVAPDGSLTADKITEDATATTTHLISQTGTLISIVGSRYTYSVYAKADGRNWIAISPGSTWGYAWFDISAGALGTVFDGGGATTASITNVGNGWYRCAVSATAVDVRGVQIFLANANSIVAYTGDGASGVYLWGAQLEQSSTVGEYVPTTTAAVTVNTTESLGLLVEEARTNTLLQSNQFDTLWTLDTGNPTISLVSQTAPDGGAQSWKLTEGTSTGLQDIFQTGVSNSSGSSVYSVYAKAAERFKLSLRESTTTGLIALFDLSAGSVVTVAGGGTPSPIATITPVKNGWYRCSVLFNQVTASNRTFRIFVVEDAETTANGSIASRTGDGTSGLYLWGAQLEAGAFSTSYIPTTDAAATRAADVASISGSNFGVSRTNLVLRSEEFETGWGRGGVLAFGSGSVTDAAIAPNGTMTADLITEDTSVSSVHRVSQGCTVAAGSHTASIYAKRANGIRNVEINANALTNARAVFDLSSGAVGEVSNGTASIQSVGNGWYRCSVTGVSAGGASTLFIQMATDTTAASSTYTGDGTSGIYLWGAQLEAGSTATAYIPTTTAAVTVFESPWYRQDSGSWYCSATSLVFDSNERGLFGIDTGSFARGYHAATNSPTRIRTRRRDATNNIATDATLSAGTSARVALVATSTEQATTYNGGAVITNATALTLDPITDLRIGYQNITGAPADRYLCGCLSRLTYWPARLPNETLQTITQ